MNLKKIFLALLLIASSNVKADFNIVYDAETQDVVSQIAAPIFKAAKLKRPEIYIIQDSSPNAFTMGGEVLYINTGLIAEFTDPNILRGVIAHEVGHISARHVSRMQMKAMDQRKLAASSLILGLVGAALTGSPELAIHGALVGSHVAERSMLKFSRENETSADLKAQIYLEQSGYNSQGLVTLLEHFGKLQRIPLEARYDITHPISSERISLIKAKKSNFNKFTENAQLKKNYELVSAKISAFTLKTFNRNKYSGDALKYADSIVALKRSDKTSSLRNIDALLSANPRNPYFYQLKGEILSAFGDMKALDSYSKAVSIYNNELIKIEFSIAKIRLSNDKTLIKSAISNLELSSPKLLYNNGVLDYLATGYDKLGNTAYSQYYRALAQKNKGNLKLAKKIAKQAKINLPQGSPLFLKINDIIDTEEEK